MKRIFLIILVFIVFLSSYAYSAPSYGTKMPRKWQWFWSLESNFLDQRNLDKNLGQFRSYQNFIAGSVGLTDWLCLDLAGGGGDIRYKPPNAPTIKYSQGFAGKYGGRIKVYNRADSRFKAVFGFQHISVHPRHRIVNNVKRRAIFDDWQFSLVGSYDIKPWFSPYLGVKASRGDLIEWLGEDRTRRKSEDSEMVGGILGLNLFLKPEFWLNLEIRYFDEKAASCAVRYAF